jgi:hypothetical protein
MFFVFVSPNKTDLLFSCSVFFFLLKAGYDLYLFTPPLPLLPWGLLGRHSTTWAIPQPLYLLLVLSIPGLVSEQRPSWRKQEDGRWALFWGWGYIWSSWLVWKLELPTVLTNMNMTFSVRSHTDMVRLDLCTLLPDGSYAVSALCSPSPCWAC